MITQSAPAFVCEIPAHTLLQMRFKKGSVYYWSGDEDSLSLAELLDPKRFNRHVVVDLQEVTK